MNGDKPFPAVPAEAECGAIEVLVKSPRRGEVLARLTLTARQHRRLMLYAVANDCGLGGALRLAVDYLTEEETQCEVPPEVAAEDDSQREGRGPRGLRILPRVEGGDE